MSQSGIKDAFRTISDGILAGAKMRQLFDETRDLLRSLEALDRSGKLDKNYLGHAGRLAGLTRALNLLDGWPLPDYKARYEPRVKTIVDKLNR